MNLTFENNSATTGSGGAIFTSKGKIIVENVNFTNNTAFVSGGAITLAVQLT